MTLPFPRAAPGPALRFTVADADHDPHALGPTLRLHVTATETTGTRVHALALRTQIRIEPKQRRYSGDEQHRLVELFGEPARWGQTLNPMQLATVSTVLPAFGGGEHAGRATTTLEIPLTFDTEVAATRYFRGLDAGEVPLLLLFSGSIFYATDAGVQVGLVPWHTEATYRLPITVWQDMMTAHHGGTAWLQVPTGTMERLSAWRSARALPNWEQTFQALLEAASVGEEGR